MSYGSSASSIKTYATWDYIRKGTNVTLSNGNKTAQSVGGSVISTIGKSSGKWYWEYKLDYVSAYQGHVFGVGTASTDVTSYIGATTASYGWIYWLSGAVNAVYNNAGVVTAAYGSAYVTNDVIGMALDMDAGTLKIYKNNTLLGTACTGLTGTYYAAWGDYSSQTTNITANFGATAMTYSPPSGYNAGLYEAQEQFVPIISVNGVFGASGGTTSAIDTTGAELLVAGIWCLTSAGENLSDSKGNTWTKLTSQINFGMDVVLYYCINPTVGSGHTFSTTSHFVGVGVAAFSSTGSGPTYDTQNGANQNASGNLQPGSITPAVNGSVVVTAFGSFNGSTSGGPAIPTNYIGVARNTTSTAEAGGLGFWIQTTATATNPTWNDNGSSECAVIASWKP